MPAVRRYLATPEGLAGAIILAMIALVALLAPVLFPGDPLAIVAEPMLRPFQDQNVILGTDRLGRDVLAELVHGARTSLLVGLVVVVVAGSIGTAVGAVAGFAGGRVESLLMRSTDVFLAFPGILLAIAFVAVLGPALSHVVVALVLIGWVGYARLVRAQVLQWKRRDFVLAARAAGVPRRRIVLRHLLPNVLPELVVQATLGLAGAILAEAGLSFLGLGIEPPAPSWGAMINSGRSHLLDAPHLSLFPGLAILAAVVGLHLLGDGVIDLLDPRRKSGPR